MKIMNSHDHNNLVQSVSLQMLFYVVIISLLWVCFANDGKQHDLVSKTK